MYIPNILTKGSVALIKKAKKDKLSLSCSVSIQNLCFTDKKLNDFNTSAKLFPVRDKNDMISLRKALLDGTIDMVTSDHSPINIELKDIEFNLAHFGSIGLENTFGALLSIYDINQVISILNRGKELLEFLIAKLTSVLTLILLYLSLHLSKQFQMKTLNLLQRTIFLLVTKQSVRFMALFLMKK